MDIVTEYLSPNVVHHVDAVISDCLLVEVHHYLMMRD